MKILSLLVCVYLLGVTGCIVESNRPANSTPETAASASATATTDPSATTTAVPQYPPPMREAPKPAE
jgi:hypothetical protein